MGDNLSYMYLFNSSSSSDSDDRPYSFTLSGTQAVASTDSTVALHPDEKVNMQGGGRGKWGSGMELGKQHHKQYWLGSEGRAFVRPFGFGQYSGVILDRVSFHGRFVHLQLPSFLPQYTNRHPADKATSTPTLAFELLTVQYTG